jgi:macrolide transport system ATP-binding/permease protein
VLPPTFQFAPRARAEIWTTLDTRGSCETRRSCHNLDGIARLRNGVSVAAALANTATIARQLEAQYPDSNRGQGASVVPLSEVIVGDIRPVLLVLLGGAALLLVIACVNVASLLLVRSESRARELAVRSALGASTFRLTAQFVTEAVALVGAGTLLGLTAASWAMQLLSQLIPSELMDSMPFLRGLGLNVHVLAAAAAIAVLALTLFAIVPALRASRSDLRQDMAEGARGSAGTVWHRLGARLVVIELATAMVLLVGAGLLGKSLYQLLRVEVGFNPDHLAIVGVAAPDSVYPTPERRVLLGREVLSRATALPGVASAAIASQSPVTFNGNTTWIRIAGRPYNGAHNEVNERAVSPGYFATLQAKLLRGRGFTDRDVASTRRVAIINQALARKYFPGENPVGQQIGDTTLSPSSISEIVGVVDDIREGPLDSEIWPAVYFPFDQDSDTYFSLVVRTSQTEASILNSLTAAVRGIDVNVGTLSPTTMTDQIHDSPVAYLHRSATWLVGGFAALAWILGLVGLYGVIAYSVSQRTREIGVRIALGAQQRAVHRMIAREAGALAVSGIVAGLACAVLAATVARNLLFGTPPWDMSTLGSGAVVLGVSALVASYLPARRAASVNPIEALRVE